MCVVLIAHGHIHHVMDCNGSDIFISVMDDADGDNNSNYNKHKHRSSNNNKSKQKIAAE